MIQHDFIFSAPDGVEIFVYKWLPEGHPKAIINIAHGMAETAARYERLARVLTNEGYAVYAEDHRGHGKTIKDPLHAGEAGHDALNLMLADLHQVSQIAKNENPQVPLFLLGHSMGSFLAQGYIARWGKELNGVILSGTAGPANLLTAIGQLIARLEILRIGPNGKSRLLHNLSFGSYNKQFQPTRTDFDWLSRDNAEVDQYIADPFCGGFFPALFFYNLLKFWRQVNEPEAWRQIPVTLPIYFISGTKDPLGANTRGVQQLMDIYKKFGIKDVSFNFYEDGRHEMFNETNREVVFTDLINWLNSHC